MGKAVHLPLWAPIHPCLPLPRKGKGTIEVMGWRFPEGHGAKHGTEITVIVSTHPGQIILTKLFASSLDTQKNQKWMPWVVKGKIRFSG